MSWLNLNQSFSSIKGQITNFASEVLSEGNAQDSGDKSTEIDQDLKYFKEKCEAQEAENRTTEPFAGTSDFTVSVRAGAPLSGPVFALRYAYLPQLVGNGRPRRPRPRSLLQPSYSRQRVRPVALRADSLRTGPARGGRRRPHGLTCSPRHTGKFFRGKLSHSPRQTRETPSQARLSRY
ncbi:hypothetical protein EVAR_79204_1 [Eumeta japonica]|uniref:Uncharacterized protein n=1 Tax=Eumeta variegata TaxID=151549 RepID=A0A4C1UT90_EUMVA|nr:hypothetical protein EVAR_79204_1 [Eumeta japonica]